MDILSLGMLNEFIIGVELSLQPLPDSGVHSIEGGTVSISFSTSDSDELDFSFSFEAAEDFFKNFIDYMMSLHAFASLNGILNNFLQQLPFHPWFSLLFLVKTSAMFNHCCCAHFCSPLMLQ